MKPSWLAATCLLVSLVRCYSAKFPQGFKFGAATSSYQIEGAWNVSDKSESIWDRFVHNDPNVILDLSNGDIACDSYNKWMDDVNIASDLGLHFYRFSISWPRLLPNGTTERISEDGRKYYDSLINALLQKGIEPVVTLYHWDLPQRFQDLGGWANPHTADWFADYTKIAFKLFGDRVKIWITINEPTLICEAPYNSGFFAPGIIDPDFGSYLCSKNVLLAHAKAWRVYDEEFRPKYGGKIGITHQLIWYEASSPEHEELAALVRDYMERLACEQTVYLMLSDPVVHGHPQHLKSCVYQLGNWIKQGGIYTHPIYSKDGGWPPQIERIVAENSKKQGFARSRLPPFTKEEIDLIKGTFDFCGFNFYTNRLVREARADEEISMWPIGTGSKELNAALEVDPKWKKGAIDWFYIDAPGIRKMLRWLKGNYGDLEVFITENGMAELTDIMDDKERVEYYRNHLEQVWLAINEDGVNVTGYTAWSLIDNFEWVDGYGASFGLYHVDFKDPERPRTPRSSAYYYANVIRSHSYDVQELKRDEL